VSALAFASKAESWLSMQVNNSLTYTLISSSYKINSMAKIKTFEGACKLLKLDPAKVLPKVTGMPKHHQEATVAHAKLVIIAEALNMEANNGKRWEPDWTNGNWDKYYPWFRMSGSGLSFDDYVFQISYSYVGSRLCYISSDVAEYAGKTFKKLYQQYFCM
ncbi:MAG: hypothetical protein ABL876_18020, partial [Chitinophagaceae bacterium]